ncbi:PfkB family carbohydrate kinase [candidate division KSB1 bacterium]
MLLDLKPQEDCELDFLSLGECMIRLIPPGHQRIELTPYFEAWCGGAEYNISYALARLDLRTGWISKLVNNPLGHFIRNHAQTSGMNFSEVVWVPYDGVGRNVRVGLNFSEIGKGMRSSVMLYDRGHSAASQMKFEDFDWDRIFNRRKVRWFHTSGSFNGVSKSAADVIKRVIPMAKQSGAVISYDLNYRSTLWSREKALEATKPLIPYVDVLTGSAEDYQCILGHKIEDYDKKPDMVSRENYKIMIQNVINEYPDLKVIAITLRQSESALLHNWSALLYHEGYFYESRKFDKLEIEDRVGGGDGFCSGLIYGIFNGYEPQECVDLGITHGALIQSTRGNTSIITEEDLLYVFKGGQPKIRR